MFVPDETAALDWLEIVFQQLRSHNLKLSPKKCHLIQASVKFLGHIIDGNGVSIDPSRSKVKTEAKVGTYRKLKPTDWAPECDDALSKLKESLLQSVVLAHPDFSFPLILSTDASLEGLGAVLSQIPAGEEKVCPVAFASKSLSNSQKKYPTHKLKFLALTCNPHLDVSVLNVLCLHESMFTNTLKWSVCVEFSHWLKGHTFTVWRDNNPFTYIPTNA